MSVDHFPGEFRVGVLNEKLSGVEDSGTALITPKFLVLILLRGRQDFYLDDKLIELHANHHDDNAPVGFAVSLLEPCKLRFAGSWGDPFRKISIAGPPDWFDHIEQDISGTNSLPHFPSRHLEQQLWRPGSDTVRLANQIIFSPPEENKKQLGLFRMSRALEVLRRIPQDIAVNSNETAETSTPKTDLKTHERIRLHIMQNLSEDLSLEHLERTFHLNRRSIQRRFKQEYGMGLVEFIRKARLNLANLALQKEGVTISNAAYLAGYSNAANFSTAFRREYGVSPSDIRNTTV